MAKLFWTSISLSSLIRFFYLRRNENTLVDVTAQRRCFLVVVALSIGADGRSDSSLHTWRPCLHVSCSGFTVGLWERSPCREEPKNGADISARISLVLVLISFSIGLTLREARHGPPEGLGDRITFSGFAPGCCYLCVASWVI